MTAVVWFRRDLRLDDHAALEAALDAAEACGSDVLPLYVLDPGLSRLGASRRARLLASLAALSRATGGALVVRTGDPREVVPAVAAEVEAGTVHVTGEHTPYARLRDAAVASHLADAGVLMTSAGSCHAVAPGTLTTQQGGPYRVFTPFLRAWREEVERLVHSATPVRHDGELLPWHRWVESDPLDAVETVPTWVEPRLTLPGTTVPGPGEQTARARWQQFRRDDLHAYGDGRDRPDLEATSRMSVALRFGEVNPLSVVRDLLTREPTPGTDRFLAELAWRDFHADVLWHNPATAWHDLRHGLAGLADDEPGPAFATWQEGRTGFPLVDAGMRQLRETGWMHNRVRMVTASFLVKDLHVTWQHGARHFLDHLLDGDLASNNGNWQWVAGTGTDAAPYHRVFNPTTQAKRFDPDGAYVRRWVPELAHLPGAAALEPWKHPEGYAHGYPTPVVDHAAERRETLDRYERARREVTRVD